MVAEKKRLLIIDANSLIHRAYHALPPLTTKRGELVNAIYGFFLVFLKATRELQPDFLVACFDFPAKTFRHKKFKEYKAKRPKIPKELSWQILKIKEILKNFKVAIFEKEGFEADDLIGTISKLAPKKQIIPKLETIILSGDLDTLELVDSQTKVCNFKKGVKETIFYDIEKVKEKYQGLLPEQLPDFKALRGDPSDNIPGIPGIGEKTAIKLIKEFQNLENLYENLKNSSLFMLKEKAGKNFQFFNKLKEYKEQAFFSKQIAKINCNVPIEFDLRKCQWQKYDKKKIIEVFKKFEFYSLIPKLPN
jgi:DNA polymerase-1